MQQNTQATIPWQKRTITLSDFSSSVAVMPEKWMFESDRKYPKRSTKVTKKNMMTCKLIKY